MTAIDREALTVAMAIVPGLYSRNRMFGLFKDPEVKRARSRASTILGIVRQLAGSHGEVQVTELTRPGHSDAFSRSESYRIRYRIARLGLERHVELSAVEIACVVVLAVRAGVSWIHPTAEERALVDTSLGRLALGPRAH